MNISANLKSIQKEVGAATIVAISKTKPKEDIEAAYAVGQRIFGENRAQELEEKAAVLPKDIQWHMVGNLQSNKVKYIAPFVDLIHSVDKLSLLKEINKRARQNNRVIDVLLQMYIADEESKSGLNEEDLKALLESKAYHSFENIRVVGMMGMATLTDNKAQIKKEFSHLKDIFDNTKASYFSEDSNFSILSMGMSGDYKIALDCGSNMIRVGSAIFGSRDYA